VGWFLHKKSDKRRKRGQSPMSASGAMGGWDPQRTLAGLKILGIAAAVILTIVGYCWLEQSLMIYTSQTTTATVLAEQIRLIDAPQWLDQDVAQRLQRITAQRINDDPMDAESLRIAAKVLAAEPWIAGVRQVRRGSNGVVSIHADYRQPVALIEMGNAYGLVDRQGALLKWDDPATWALPVITGISRSRLAMPGQRYSGEDITAALALAQTLGGEPYMDQVTSIDASGRDRMGRVQLVLYTDRSWVVWGPSPGSERSWEPGAAKKLGLLREAARVSTIDAAGRGFYLNRAAPMIARATNDLR